MANGTWAVVLPDQTGKNQQVMQMLWQHNMQQQRFDALSQQREYQRQANAAKFVGDSLKDTNYATGTAADPIINKMTSDARQKFAKMIHENPNIDEGDLEMQMQGEISKISQYSSAIKAGRKNIEDSTQHYQNMPGIDVGMLKGAAINRLVYQGGKQIVDDPNKIDLSRNYLQEELDANPQHYVMGDTPLVKTIEGFKPKEGGDTTTSEHAGVTTQAGYTAKQYPWQSLEKDAKGNVTGLKVNSVPAVLSNGQALVDPVSKQPLQVVDSDTFNRVMSPAVSAMVRRDTNDYITSHGMDPKDFPEGSDGYQVLSKHILLNKLSDLTPSEFKKETKKTNATFVDKMQAGVVDALGRQNTKAEELRQEKLFNGNYARILKGLNLDPQIIDAAEPYTDKATGKQYYDITNVSGGFHTIADKDKDASGIAQKKVERLLVDPSQPGTLTTSELGPDGQYHLHTYNKNEVPGLLTKHASANGHDNLADVNKVVRQFPVSPNTGTATSAQESLNKRADQEQQAAYQIHSQSMARGVTRFLADGNTHDLVGQKVPDGKIKSVSKQGWYQSGKYKVTVVGSDGKESDKTFATDDALKKYLTPTAPESKKSVDQLGNQYGF